MTIRSVKKKWTKIWSACLLPLLLVLLFNGSILLAESASSYSLTIVKQHVEMAETDAAVLSLGGRAEAVTGSELSLWKVNEFEDEDLINERSDAEILDLYGAPLSIQVTDSNGRVLFSDLAAGTYHVRELVSSSSYASELHGVPFVISLPYRGEHGSLLRHVVVQMKIVDMRVPSEPTATTTIPPSTTEPSSSPNPTTSMAFSDDSEPNTVGDGVPRTGEVFASSFWPLLLLVLAFSLILWQKRNT